MCLFKWFFTLKNKNKTIASTSVIKKHHWIHWIKRENFPGMDFCSVGNLFHQIKCIIICWNGSIEYSDFEYKNKKNLSFWYSTYLMWQYDDWLSFNGSEEFVFCHLLLMINKWMSNNFYESNIVWASLLFVNPQQ